MPTTEDLYKWYEGRVDESFSNEAAPDGTKWKPLAAVTLMLGIASKKGFKKSGYLGANGRKYLQSKFMLFRSGDLKNSVHSQADKSGVTIGSNGVGYAAIHQFGGPAGRNRKVHIPARPYLAMNKGTTLVLAERDRVGVFGIIQDEINKFTA